MSTHPHNVYGQHLTAEHQSASRVFLSHRSADKAAVRELAEYLEYLQVFYFFDERDETLRRLREQGHSEPQAVVNAIDDGLAHSTHLLGILSQRTMGSWWVPYEIGASRAKGYPTAFLLLPSITPEMVPEYVRATDFFWSASELRAWCEPLGKWPAASIQNSYSEWSQDGLFVETGPDPEEVEYWYEQARQENTNQLRRLEDRLLECD